MVLFITLNNARWYQLTFKSVDEILKCDHSNESYWAVLSCGTVNTLYKVVLTFESVDEILKCDHLNESPSAAFYCGAVYYAVQGSSSSEGVAGGFLVTKVSCSFQSKLTGRVSHSCYSFSQSFYYFALASDLFLRLSWILTVSVGEAGLFHSEVLTALLAVLEVFR